VLKDICAEFLEIIFKLEFKSASKQEKDMFTIKPILC
jgi:hypothetical protein